MTADILQISDTLQKSDKKMHIYIMSITDKTQK